MDILEKIIRDKRKEIELKKQVHSVFSLEKLELFKRQTISLSTSIGNSSNGIISEFKRRSPSKSLINQTANIWDVAQGYENAQVSGMSVLTDGKYFGGSIDDLILARAACNLPILRKEFIIDQYQLFEAKAYGADAILLIAAVLDRKEIKELSELAKSLKLEVLLEIHNEAELEKSLMPSLDMIGVNNRNLKTFKVSLDTSKALSNLIPTDFIKVSESGISSIKAIKKLRSYGFQGFLIGENFMKTDNPGDSAKAFIQKL